MVKNGGTKMVIKIMFLGYTSICFIVPTLAAVGDYIARKIINIKGSTLKEDIKMFYGASAFMWIFGSLFIFAL